MITKEKILDEKIDKNKIVKYPDNIGLAINTEYLYWMIKNNAAVVAIKSSKNTINVHEKVERVKFKFEPGLRIGIGYNSLHDEWGIYSYWTYIHSNISKTLKETENYEINPVSIGTPIFGDSSAKYSKGTWLLRYNRWDLEMGRYFYPGKYFSIRPNFGLLGLLIKQKFTNASIDEENNNFGFCYKNNFWGIGLKGGVHIDCHLSHCFTLFNKITTALIWEKERVPTDEYETGEANEFSSNNYSKIKPLLQIMLGFAYGKYFNKDKIFFNIYTAYETNYIWDKLSYSSAPEDNHDLEFSGVTLGMKFEF